jgi:hypothetical protein
MRKDRLGSSVAAADQCDRPAEAAKIDSAALERGYNRSA